MDKSYLFGLMATDGCMRKVQRGDKVYYSCSIELKDEQIIKDIADYFNIKYFHRKRIVNNKERHFYKVTIPRKFYLGYEELFRSCRKGLVDLYNQSDKNSFIRGIFDGDGSVTEMSNSKNLLRVGITINSKCFDLYYIVTSFFKDNKFQHMSEYLDKRGVGCYYLSLNNKLDVNKFFNLIYSNNPKLFLERKFKVFVKHGFPIQ